MKIVMFVVGVIIGLLGVAVPRMSGTDLLKSLENKAAHTEAGAEAAKPAEDSDVKKAPNSKDPSVHPKEVELRSMIADVTKQRASLEEREKPLAMREAQLEERRKALDAMKQSIDEGETHLKKQIVEVDASEIKNLKKLGKMWSQMEPTDVVRLAAGVDKDVAVKVLATMTERQSGAILGAMATSVEFSKLASEFVVRLKQLKQPAPVTNGDAQ